MFKVAKQTKVFQNVVEQIQEAILDGRLKAGESLPSERGLKEMFGVSRGTLREALRVLEQKGLIEIRLGVGGGSIVKPLNTDSVTESLGLLIRSRGVSLAHLAQFREDVEGVVAARAAGQRNHGHIQDLKQLLRQARKCVDGGVQHRQEFIQLDKQFHMKLAEITANPIFIFVLHSIHENIHRYYDRFLSMETPELEENYRFLKAVVSAIETGDQTAARQLVQAHVRKFNQYMERRQRTETVSPQGDIETS
jgi:DNA-binding FadR family transcriptional regulator